MPLGYFALVLHAHLPFVRHPEHARHLEERWFYEAMIECYLPLLDAFDRLETDGVPFALTMSVTPPLAAMMKDELLRKRFAEHLGRIQRLADKETVRLRADTRFGPVAAFYREELARVRDVWERHDGDVLAGLVRHWDAGRIELLTCSATHCYLPGMLPAREGIRPQLELGVRGFESIVGRRPNGAWLAECAYHPSFDRELADAGIRFTLVDTHGITHATPRPPVGVHAPIVSPSGVAFFGRDAESSRQVWSRDEGYPGDAYYRDFYRDIGFDLPESELMGEIAGDGSRLMTGLKYFRITGKDIDKEAYQPGVARQKAWEHAGNFVHNRAAQMRHLAGTMETPPIVVSPYDAELYGHWWFEGPIFLDLLIRKAALQQESIRLQSPVDYLAEYPEQQLAQPPMSSWGAGGYAAVWLDESNDWIYRYLHKASERMIELARLHQDASGVQRRALNQAARELLLAQSSDWAFIIKTGTMVDYAVRRTREHLLRFTRLYEQIKGKSIDEPWLSGIEGKDNLFPEIDYRVYRPTA